MPARKASASSRSAILAKLVVLARQKPRLTPWFFYAQLLHQTAQIIIIPIYKPLSPAYDENYSQLSACTMTSLITHLSLAAILIWCALISQLPT